jgi:hypothetical protein
VADARIYDGVHYRFSTEVGAAMGKQVGALAVATPQELNSPCSLFVDRLGRPISLGASS